MEMKSIKRVGDFNNSHGIIVVMDHESTKRRFNAVINRTSLTFNGIGCDCYGTGQWAIGGEDLQYVGESYEGFVVIETASRFELILVEDGVRIQLRRHLLEDGEVLNMDTDWIELLPVVRWFMTIEGEDLKEDL